MNGKRFGGVWEVRYFKKVRNQMSQSNSAVQLKISQSLLCKSSCEKYGIEKT